jgi:hypothetical protein
VDKVRKLYRVSEQLAAAAIFENYDSVWNDLPRCFGAHKNVPANLDVRVSIRTAKRHSVNSSLKYAAEC